MQKVTSAQEPVDNRTSNVTELTEQAQDQIVINKEPKDDNFQKQVSESIPNRRFTRNDDTDDNFVSKNEEGEPE